MVLSENIAKLFILLQRSFILSLGGVWTRKRKACCLVRHCWNGDCGYWDNFQPSRYHYI